jgi:hypothetical protein
MISLYETYRSKKHSVFLINGRSVRLTTCSTKVLHLSLQVPAIIYLERVDLHGAVDVTGLPDRIDDAILSHDTSISG